LWPERIEKMKRMNSVSFGQLLLHKYIALCCLSGPHLSSIFVNKNDPIYISDKDTKREIVSMLCECIICGFPVLQSAPTMEKDRSITHTWKYP
jgi:hypothetical protein